MKELTRLVTRALEQGRTVHFLPPYRHDWMIRLMDLTGIHPSQQRDAASLTLIKAVVAQRSVKSEGEIAEIERWWRTLGYCQRSRLHGLVPLHRDDARGDYARKSQSASIGGRTADAV